MRRRALLLGALGLAGAAPQPVPEGFRLDDYRAPVPDTLRGAEVVGIDGVRGFVGRPGVVLIDVLPAPRRPPDMRPEMPWLPPPHRSLPGALWWPGVGRGALSTEAEADFHARLGAIVPGTLLVFFCLSDCWMSWNAAKRAVGWGYRVAWFPDGVDRWEAAGLPTAAIKPDRPE